MRALRLWFHKKRSAKSKNDLKILCFSTRLQSTQMRPKKQRSTIVISPNCRAITFLILEKFVGENVTLIVRWLFSSPHTPLPISREHHFYGVTRGFRRLSMKTRYVCHGLIRSIFKIVFKLLSASIFMLSWTFFG